MLTAFLRALDSCAPGSSSGLGAPVIESHSESVSLGIIHSEFTRAHTHMVWYGMAWCRSPPLLPAAGPLPGLDARKKRLRRLELGGAPLALRFPLSAGRSEMIGCKRRSYAKADSHPPPAAVVVAGCGTDGPLGIGVFFYTRKGQFLYKISSYIITYHVAIMIYHCVSSSVS